MNPPGDISTRFTRPSAPQGRKDSAWGFNPGLRAENASPCKGGRKFSPDYAMKNESQNDTSAPSGRAVLLIIYPGVETPG
jgi:hypothetical protein